MKIYLAGPMCGQPTEDARCWRKIVESECLNCSTRFHFLSPLRGQPQEVEVFPAFYEGEDPVTDLLHGQRGLFTRDKWDVQRADIIFANFQGTDRVSIGTVMEIAWAHLLNKPVIAVMDELHANHPMLSEAISFPVDSLDVGIQVLKGLV